MSLDINKIKEQIEHGNTSLGIELGSTRIKAVLICEDHTPIASGSHDWENRYVDHIWTYTLEDIWTGIRDCYGKMAEDVKALPHLEEHHYRSCRREADRGIPVQYPSEMEHCPSLPGHPQ